MNADLTPSPERVEESRILIAAHLGNLVHKTEAFC